MPGNQRPKPLLVPNEKKTAEFPTWGEGLSLLQSSLDSSLHPSHSLPNLSASHSRPERGESFQSTGP